MITFVALAIEGFAVGGLFIIFVALAIEEHFLTVEGVLAVASSG